MAVDVKQQVGRRVGVDESDVLVNRPQHVAVRSSYRFVHETDRPPLGIRQARVDAPSVLGHEVRFRSPIGVPAANESHHDIGVTQVDGEVDVMRHPLDRGKAQFLSPMTEADPVDRIGAARRD
jgi:hypothetical protein